MTTIDVFTAEIVRNALASASLEMNKTLRRTAYNPLLYDVQDFGLGIVSADGLLWGEAPGQSGSCLEITCFEGRTGSVKATC